LGLLEGFRALGLLEGFRALGLLEGFRALGLLGRFAGLPDAAPCAAAASAVRSADLLLEACLPAPAAVAVTFSAPLPVRFTAAVPAAGLLPTFAFERIAARS